MSVNINPQTNPPIPYREVERGPKQPPIIAHAKKEAPDSKLLKPASFISATAGICVAIALIAKKQKIKLFEKTELSEIFKPKNWNFSKLKYDTKEVFQIASASTAGGLLAGLALDSENKKAKIKEGLQQLIGNLMVPIGLVAVATKIFDKHENKLNITNKNTKNIIKISSSLGTLAVGMVIGNVVAKKLNELIFGEKHHRNLEVGDLAGQIDDICLATMLISPENKFLQKISKFIPVALIVPGYETGKKKNRNCIE